MTASPSVAEVEEQFRASGDDTFLPLADFLTLLSMAFIYAALVFARPTTTIGDVGLNVAEAARGGPAVPVDQLHAYVAILSAGEKMAVRVVVPGDDEIHEWALVPKEIVVNDEIRKVTGLLDGRSIPEGVIFFMSPNESRAEAHQLLNELMRKVRATHAVQVVL